MASHAKNSTFFEGFEEMRIGEEIVRQCKNRFNFARAKQFQHGLLGLLLASNMLIVLVGHGTHEGCAERVWRAICFQEQPLILPHEMRNEGNLFLAEFLARQLRHRIIIFDGSIGRAKNENFVLVVSRGSSAVRRVAES